MVVMNNINQKLIVKIFDIRIMVIELKNKYYGKHKVNYM